MKQEKIKIMAISGSLRPGSSNNMIIKVVADMVPPGVEMEIYTGLASIPAFDDVDNEPVNDFRRCIREADGVFICTPEYAFGVPGALKNALDWTVSTGDFDKKPTALVTASSVGDKGHAALLHTLTAISADVAPDATLLISFIRSKINANGEITDPAVSAGLKAVLDALIRVIKNNI